MEVASTILVTPKNMDDVRRQLVGLGSGRPLSVASGSAGDLVSSAKVGNGLRLLGLGAPGKGCLPYKLGTAAGKVLLERCVNAGDTIQSGSNADGRYIFRHTRGEASRDEKVVEMTLDD
jgi:hypothetical protein